MYKVYDISLPIYEGMPVYKNKPEKQPTFQTVQNGYVTETRVALDVHTGTHVDAHLHMIPAGETIETIPLERVVGPCRVIDLMQVADRITLQDVQAAQIKEGEFILFKTKNSLSPVFDPEFVFIAEEAARYLAECSIRGVGIDALGVERNQPGHPTHKALFGANIVVIEGLQLAEVPAGNYFLVAAPLKLQGLDASPVRALLIEGTISTGS